jgi:Transposase zinc-binding domain/Putative transposase
MQRPALELADIFRLHGPAYRQRHDLPLHQLKLMQAIETRRTAALGGHVEQCGQCEFTRICYNSCRNRHCPKCQSLARAKWLEQRKAELLPVEYFHLVFTLPEQIAAIAFQNKSVAYDILFRATAETLLTIARDPKHLGAEIGFFCVLHTWGQNLQHHPHLHLRDSGWRSIFRLRALDRLPPRLLPSGARAVALVPPPISRRARKGHQSSPLQFFSDLQPLQDPQSFTRYLDPLREAEWVVVGIPCQRKVEMSYSPQSRNVLF